MLKTNYPLQEEKTKISAEEYFDIGEQKGHFILDGSRIKYTAAGKSYDFSDPKEKTRMMFYFDLIEKYKYPADKIEFEVGVFNGKTVDRYANIVVFTNNKGRKPYMVVECEKDGISDLEFERAIERAADNAWSLGALFAVCAAGAKHCVVELDELNNKAEVSDIPIYYGETKK